MDYPRLGNPDDLARQRLLPTNPSLWPCWPFLPLVRRGEGGEELGVMFDARTVCGLMGFSATVLITNLFLMPHNLAEILTLPREVFDTTDELLAANWRID